MAWVRHNHEGRLRGRTWEKLRNRVLTEQPLCYLRVDGCTMKATEVDHVIPLARGGTHERSNLRGICAHCHKWKVAKEAADGKPKARRDPEPPPGLRKM